MNVYLQQENKAAALSKKRVSKARNTGRKAKKIWKGDKDVNVKVNSVQKVTFRGDRKKWPKMINVEIAVAEET